MKKILFTLASIAEASLLAGKIIVTGASAGDRCTLFVK